MPKICGITGWEDAVMAIESGAGALGFNFYQPSPRSISANDDLKWIGEIGAAFPDIARVAVVVNPDAELLKKLQAAKCFEAIQFHGDESPEYCASEGAVFKFWIKAIRVRNETDLGTAITYQTPFLLLDAAVPGNYGGSGETLDWSLATKFVAEHPEKHVILAGGLTPSNVAGAVAQVHPHAVDVASGVERAPGCKDPEKIHGFIAAAFSRALPE